MEIEVLSNSVNFPVMRLPGRRFPGSLIQGDSLSILHQLATSIFDRAKKLADQELIDDTQELLALLHARLQIYEETLSEHGLPLPYNGSLASKVQSDDKDTV
jgi:hypothetical protein